MMNMTLPHKKVMEQLKKEKEFNALSAINQFRTT